MFVRSLSITIEAGVLFVFSKLVTSVQDELQAEREIKMANID